LVLWVFCTSAFASSPGAQLFDGNAAYRAGEYAGAESAYRALLEQDVVNGHVLYNLGNSLYRQDRLSQAMLAWRRAEVLLPRDPDIRANLVRAREATKDRMPALSSARPLFFWQRRLSPKEGVLLGSLLTGLGFGVLLVSRWRRRDWRVVGAGVVAVGGLVLVGGVDEARTLSHSPAGLVLADEVEVRSAVGGQGVDLFQLHAGAEVRVREASGEHVQIELTDGRRGWLPALSVGQIVPKAPFPVL
jgi:tetratricopeptide (TPR) repeat protein